MPLIAEAAARALKPAGIEQADHVIVSSPHLKAAAAAAKRLAGRIPEEAPAIGYAGTADPGLRLAAVLDRAEPGQTILLVVAVRRRRRHRAAHDRPDHLRAQCRTRRRAGRRRPRHPLRDLPDLARAAGARAAAPARARASRRPAVGPRRSVEVRLRRLRCINCGQVHVPPRRVCAGCGDRRRMERVPLADRSGRGRDVHGRPPGLLPVAADDRRRRRLRRRRALHRWRSPTPSPDEVAIGARAGADVPPPLHHRRRAQLLLEGAARGRSMASNGIRDHVAIVGMGCTPFGEHWDRSADDLLVDATEECFASTPTITQGRRRRLLAGHDGLRAVRASSSASRSSSTTSRSPAWRTSARPARRRSATPATPSPRAPTTRVMAVGVEKLKDSGYSGLVRSTSPATGRRRRSRLTAPAAFSPARPGLLPEVRRRSAGHARRDDPRRLEEPRQRREEPAGAVPQGGRQGEDRRLRRWSPGGSGIFDCSGVSDGSAAALIVRAEDAHQYTDTPMYVKALALAAGPASGPIDPAYDYTTFPEVVRCARGRLRAGRASPTRATQISTGRGPRLLHPDRARADGGPRVLRARPGVERRARRRLRPRRRAAGQPRRRPEVLRPPDRRQRPADALRVLAAVPRRGRRAPARRPASSA